MIHEMCMLYTTVSAHQWNHARCYSRVPLTQLTVKPWMVVFWLEDLPGLFV